MSQADKPISADLTFDGLVDAIEDVHRRLSRQAKAAVNTSLTLRNWLIGAYLVEYEQGGADRAEYGAQLVEQVARRLGALTRTSAHELRRFRSLYLAYPQIGETCWSSSRAFTHQRIGQLNTYVSWYAENEMTDGDNPPIGLLLCTEKDSTVVKYALAGMSNQLFVSRYQVALPSEAEIEVMLAEVLT